MILLALSTSTSRGSAAVLDGDRVLGASSYADLEGHAAERIFSAIGEALSAAGLAAKDLSALACDIGPGSFTGVRVGVAAAKGMALGLGAPLVGVGSLEAMASAAFARGKAEPGDLVVAALDAKKQELFLAAYDASGACVWAPRHVPVAEAASLILAQPGAEVPVGKSLRVVGEALAGDTTVEPFLLRAPALDLPDAAALGRVAARRLVGGASFDAAEVEPMYVRPPDAKPMASEPLG